MHFIINSKYFIEFKKDSYLYPNYICICIHICSVFVFISEQYLYPYPYMYPKNQCGYGYNLFTIRNRIISICIPSSKLESHLQKHDQLTLEIDTITKFIIQIERKRINKFQIYKSNKKHLFYVIICGFITIVILFSVTQVYYMIFLIYNI